jgi:DNA-binding NtrC family response regulator
VLGRGEQAVKLLKYLPVPSGKTESQVENRIQQLVLLARALANEIETIQAEITRDHTRSGPKQIELNSEGIDFYQEIERYEIELIRSALDRCKGNQSQAAKLLHMKSTTLNAKMKHYGLNSVRSIMVQRPNGHSPK